MDIERKRVGNSGLLDLYCTWRDLQEALNTVSEEGDAFIALLQDEENLCARICAERPASELEEAIQLFVMSSNCMIEVEEQLLERCIAIIDAAEFVLRGKSVPSVPASNIWNELCSGAIKGDNFHVPLAI